MAEPDEQVCLEAADAVYFDSAVRHSYHRAIKKSCTGVIASLRSVLHSWFEFVVLKFCITNVTDLPAE